MKFEGFSTENNRFVKKMTASADTIITDIVKSEKERLSALGMGLIAEKIVPVYFAALVGAPSENKLTDFKNALFTLRNDLIESPKFLIFIPGEMSMPSADEISYFDAVSRGVADDTVKDFIDLIHVNGDTERTEEAKKVFAEFIEPIKARTDDELFAYGVRLITWLNRCTGSSQFADSISKEIPTVMYYGNAGVNEVTLMHFLHRIGFDVLYVCAEKRSLSVLNSENRDGNMQIFEFPDETEHFPFPERLTKATFSTVAYSAEQDLNEFMYSNTSIFRDFQFSEMQALTLRTTYEEMNILWHQAAKFRTGFDVKDNKRAVVPNIFVKISGVRDGDMDNYWDEVRYKLSPMTRVIMKAPSYNKYSQSVLKAYAQFYNGTRIDIEKLKNSQYNSCSFLSDSIQYMIFEKMQEAVDSGWLMLENDELVPLVIYVGLNLDKEILKILQKFDFTKDIPKIVVIDAIEDTFSKIECIQLILFNLMGFDIAVYTPTGYKNLETYISPSAFEVYNMNEFKYNVRVPRFRIPDAIPEPKEEGFFSKLFKKKF